jgi:hypothetical protein
MKITNKENQYNVNLTEGETLEIKINGNVVISEAVGSLRKATVTYMYQESDA